MTTAEGGELADSLVKNIHALSTVLSRTEEPCTTNRAFALRAYIFWGNLLYMNPLRGIVAQYFL